MSYSSTIRIEPSGAAGVQRRLAGDTLFAAWELLRAARYVPYTAAAQGQWLTEFRRFVAAAAARLDEHVSDSESPGALLRTVARRTPELTGDVLEQLADHPRLLERATRLANTVASAGEADLALVVDVNEQAIELEMAIARHNNRLRVLLDRAGALAGASLTGAGALS